jgi:tetratricopeptide (TPR) repeat protein
MQPVLEALHYGDYDTAFETLVRTLAFAQGDAARDVALLLAEAYTLYAEGGIDGARRALEEGQAAYPNLDAHPLSRAVQAELRALEGASEPDVRKLFVEDGGEEDSRVRYHQASALLYLGVPEEALDMLHEPLELHPFMAWRAYALQGKAFERLGQAAEAAQAYLAAAQIALGLERYWNLLDAAAMLVEAAQGEAALSALQEAANLVESEDPEDAATRHYLGARAQLLLGNPSLALEAIQKARTLEAEGAEAAHGTPLVEGQALMQLGQYAEAIEAFHEAVLRSEEPDKAYAQHELAVAALEAGDLGQAESVLREVVRGGEYGYQGEAWGDLAEVMYRQGRMDEAQGAAAEALNQGATSAGKLILGNLAYDSMNLEEALEHYQTAAEAASEGSRDWVTANEMVVDVLAQLGFRRPAEVLERAHAVLPYLAEADEWHQTLTAYAERAKGMLGGRTLN